MTTPAQRLKVLEAESSERSWKSQGEAASKKLAAQSNANRTRGEKFDARARQLKARGAEGEKIYQRMAKKSLPAQVVRVPSLEESVRRRHLVA